MVIVFCNALLAFNALLDHSALLGWNNYEVSQHFSV